VDRTASSWKRKSIATSAGVLVLSKRSTGMAGDVEAAAQPRIAEARGPLDVTAALDELQQRAAPFDGLLHP
jgi:hypothetical protein